MCLISFLERGLFAPIERAVSWFERIYSPLESRASAFCPRVIEWLERRLPKDHVAPSGVPPATISSCAQLGYASMTAVQALIQIVNGWGLWHLHGAAPPLFQVVFALTYSFAAVVLGSVIGIKAFRAALFLVSSLTRLDRVPAGANLEIVRFTLQVIGFNLLALSPLILVPSYAMIPLVVLLVLALALFLGASATATVRRIVRMVPVADR